MSQAKPKELFRLRNDQLQELAKGFRPVVPNEQTTALQVAFSLGAQAVLNKLREGWVIEDAHSS